MPSISAIPESDSGFVLINLGWGDVPSVTYARAVRVDADGTETPVRMHTWTDSSGEYIELSGGYAVLYDTEAPMDVPLTYVTYGQGSTDSATTAVVMINSAGRPWLKSPLHPWQNKRLRLRDQLGSPECEPGDEIYFSSMADEARQSRSSVFPVQQRKNPISSPHTRSGIISSLRLVSRTFEARDELIELNASGDDLLFQAPSSYGIPDRYMSVGDYTVSRVLPDHKRPWRINTLPHIEVDEPAGLSDGVLGVRWADICDEYVTFGDATAASLTDTMILMGYASSPPSNPETVRLYSDIPLDFATYGDIPTGGRTYADILEGD